MVSRPELEVIAGVLYVPLSPGGRDFIAFLRKGQPRDVHWAGKPTKDIDAAGRTLEPRKSFKTWSETVQGRCRLWTDEQLETAGVLALVYGKVKLLLQLAPSIVFHLGLFSVHRGVETEGDSTTNDQACKSAPSPC